MAFEFKFNWSVNIQAEDQNVVNEGARMIDLCFVLVSFFISSHLLFSCRPMLLVSSLHTVLKAQHPKDPVVVVTAVLFCIIECTARRVSQFVSCLHTRQLMNHDVYLPVICLAQIVICCHLKA